MWTSEKISPQQILGLIRYKNIENPAFGEVLHSSNISYSQNRSSSNDNRLMISRSVVYLGVGCFEYRWSGKGCSADFWWHLDEYHWHSLWRKVVYGETMGVHPIKKTEQLDAEGTIKKIMTTEYVQNALKGSKR